MAKQRPKMPVPQTELTPQEVLQEIRRWAAAEGYTVESRPAAQEYALATVRDPDGGFTTTLIPNAHHGRRLAKHKVRYTVQQLNSGWRS